MKVFLPILFAFNVFTSNAQKAKALNSNQIKADVILDAIYKNYSAPKTNLLRENYPYDDKYTPDYLAANPGTQAPHSYAYLWPYSGTLSAATALLEATRDKRYKQLLDKKILPGLEQYLDKSRFPAGYASYVNTAKPSDRFYDDNIWLGIDFIDLYKITRQKKDLEKAKLIWKFVWSGYDEKLGGGIYWCEQKKFSKNTCSNAPAAVLAFKIFTVTKDSTFLHKGKDLYDWTKQHLQDTSDFLYYDNISLKGVVDKRKYSYNSGQMLQAAVILYQLTSDTTYLKEAENIAASTFSYFVTQTKNGYWFRDQNAWFNAVMLRGFAELYMAGGKHNYISRLQNLLDQYYLHQRDDKGLFFKTVQSSKKRKWLLDQAGFVEMFARLATLKENP